MYSPSRQPVNFPYERVPQIIVCLMNPLHEAARPSLGFHVAVTRSDVPVYFFGNRHVS